MKSGPRRLSFIVFVVVGLILGIALVGTSNARAVSTPGLFASHPSIQAQPASGRIIDDLAVKGGRLHMTYGDWTANTGPIDVATANLTDGATGVALDDVQTEATNTERTFGGYVYSPCIDPKGRGGCYATDEGGWHTVTLPAMSHTFDVARYGTDLFAVGASDAYGAVVYRSRDDGATWSLSLAEASPGGPTGWERFYWIREAGGKLYAQAAHKGYSSTCGCSSSALFPFRVWDGTRWAKASDRGSVGLVGTGSDVESFRGLLYTPRYVSTGKRTAPVGLSGIRDFYAAGDRLYAVTSAGRVANTLGVTSATSPKWTVLPGSAVPSGMTATSVAVSGSSVYVGTTAGTVYRSTL